MGTGWRHIVVTYSGTTHKVYLDGTLEASGTFATETLATGIHFFGMDWNVLDDGSGGCYSDNVANLYGLMGPVRFYSRALSAVEVKQNCWSQNARFPSSTCEAP